MTPLHQTPSQVKRLERNLKKQEKGKAMSKTFMVYFDGDIDGFKVMEALKKIKGYHHVQDVSRLEPHAELARLHKVEAFAKFIVDNKHNFCACDPDGIKSYIIAQIEDVLKS